MFAIPKINFHLPVDILYVEGISPSKSYLGNKANLTPISVYGSGSNRGCLTGEANNLVRRSDVFGIYLLLIQAGFSDPPNTPSKPLYPREVEIRGVEPLSEISVEPPIPQKGKAHGRT